MRCALCSFWSVELMLLICNSYRRCSSIMLTSDCAALTLLDSSSPDTMVTVSSVLALPPLLRRNRPSDPFCRSLVDGLTSLIRSTCDCAAAERPSGTTDTVPSVPMVTWVEGGTVKGPDSDRTGNPVDVTTAPNAVTCRSPARV